MILPRETSCRSQWLWISTCRSFVCSFATSSVTSRIVCLLSQLMLIVDSGSVICSSFSSRAKYNPSLATWERARSSASVVDVVTVSCLLALQATSPPKSLITYPWELFLSRVLSANDASLAISRPSPCPSCSAFDLVLCRYSSTLSAAFWCSGLGFTRNLASLNVAKATSGWVVTAAKRRDLIFC